MKPLIVLVLATSIAAAGCARHQDSAAPADETPASQIASASGTFPCGDSLPRDGGVQSAGTPCSIAREYCYEASGGAAISHGAHCRPLPRQDTHCEELVKAHGAGTTCTGSAATGLRVHFAFP